VKKDMTVAMREGFVDKVEREKKAQDSYDATSKTLFLLLEC